MQKNKIHAASKNLADWEIPAFTKNQADWEIPAFTKNQADWEILAFGDNQADWEILAFAENQADWEILAGIEIPESGEKPAFVEKLAELEKQAACLLFRLGGISNCWLLSGLADEGVQILVDVMNLACSLQVRRRLRLPCFYGRPSPVLYQLFVPARPCQEMAQIHAATKSLASDWNSTDFCQTTKFLTLLISILSLSRKNVHNHRCCPISAVILMTSKLEAVLKIYHGSCKTDQRGRIIWAGGPPPGTSPPAQTIGAQVASGYMPGDTISSCCSSVFSSFSTFLCFAI